MEPSLKYCTVREGDDEWHLECRFSDGQKYAAILVDGECPRLAERVASLLNGNTWTDERPTEPGEYWLSLCPDKRRPGADVERITVSSVERRQIANTARPGWTCIDSGKPSQALSVVSFDDDLFTNYFDLRASAFDGALWAPRETPADPFKEVGT